MTGRNVPVTVKPGPARPFDHLNPKQRGGGLRSRTFESPSPDAGSGGIILGSYQVDKTLASGSAAAQGTPAAPRDYGAAGRLLTLDGGSLSHPLAGSCSTLWGDTNIY